MKYVLASVGTRGDIEPFLFLGQLLLNHGHEVTGIFPEQFKAITIETGLNFKSIGPEFINMLHSNEGKLALGGAKPGFSKLLAYVKIAQMSRKINQDIVKRQKDHIEAIQPDCIIFHPKAIYPFLWRTQNAIAKTNKKGILFCPVPFVMHATRENTHLAFNNNYGTFLNKLTYKIAEIGFLLTVKNAGKQLNIQLSYKLLKQSLKNIKTCYGVSPLLFPKPSYWPDHVHVIGHNERKKPLNWAPSEELETFIKQNNKVLVITFGSMTNPDPLRLTQNFVDVVTQLNIPTIINTSVGGLVKIDLPKNNNILFTKNVPYSWLFSKVHATIHHGGAGTTHMSLKNGCSTLIIPHIIDQFMWNKLVSKQQIGPKGISVAKVEKEWLYKIIEQLWTNLIYKANAQRLAKQLNNVNDSETIYELLSD